MSSDRTAALPPPPWSGGEGFVLPSVIATEIARILSDRIVFLELVPGTRIMEEEVGASFGVSRSPIREVFRMLEADGLVVRAARRGVSVTPMSRRDLDEVYACRVGLEGLAAAEAARHIDAEGRKQVEGLLAGMRAAFDANDVPTFFQNNVAFTRAIHAASQNQTLVRVVAGIEKQALRYRYLAHLQSQEMLSMTLEGHSGVGEAVLTGKVALARRRAEQLMRRAHGVIARALAASAYALPGETGGSESGKL
jgi:GntR family transcriptional regulator, rspAB operon transcriptional repressor